MKPIYKGMFLMLICTFSSAAGQILLKKGTTIFSINSLFTNYFLIIGLFLYMVGALLLVIALRFGNLNTLYPMIALTFIWVAVASSLVLGENISLYQTGGIGFILVGVSLVAGGAK